MTLVADASVAVKRLVVAGYSTYACDLVDDGEEQHVPGLLSSEVAKAIWRKVRIGQTGQRFANAFDKTIHGDFVVPATLQRPNTYRTPNRALVHQQATQTL